MTSVLRVGTDTERLCERDSKGTLELESKLDSERHCETPREILQYMFWVKGFHSVV